MKNHWIHFFSGIIIVKITGKGLERLINNLTRNGLVIWNVRRQGLQSIIFTMKLTDIGELKKHRRGSGCRVVFLQRKGFPFLMKKSFKNSGFLLGVVLFLAIIFVLSNMVWGIDVKGANPSTEYKIYQELDKMGVKVGKLQFAVDNVESIQRHLTNNIEEITWVGVELQGTTYHLQVVEKKEPKKPEYVSPQNLVAKKKAIIVNMFVKEGQPVVGIHDSVQKGQLLVSGLIGKEGQYVQVPAQGEVLGETWYKSNVVLPIKSKFQVYNGNEQIKRYIKAGNIQIPVWGFHEKVKYRAYKIETDEKNIHFIKWKLPISIESKTYRETETETRMYSKEEAVKVATEMARADIKNRLPEDATIKGEKLLHQSFHNGKVSVSIHFQIIENIAEGQAIIQGETE